jgi:tRNA(fMet)-specific endonuclease VapC
MYLLDTNHCSRVIDGDAAMLGHLEAHRDVLVATSVIVEGELIYMAQRSEHLLANRNRVDAFLRGIRIYPIDSQTAILYGDLKSALMQRFGPRERRKRRHTTLAQLGFDDNDLWIAATARQHDLTIISSDSDFQRMRDVKPFPLEQWLPSP